MVALLQLVEQTSTLKDNLTPTNHLYKRFLEMLAGMFI